jgi:murein DD-endopeptidase MepM/ murein hydrolase activator NlpD
MTLLRLTTTIQQYRLGLALCCGLLLSTTVFSQSYDLKVSTEQLDKRHAVRVRNAGRAPIQIKLQLAEANNVATQPAFPIERVIAAGSTLEIAQLFAADARMAYQFRYSYTWIMGDPRATPDARASYRLPFEPGQRFIVSQAYGGPTLTHSRPDSQYAVDIDMPIGTPILAARSGYVLENSRPYDTGKAEPYYWDKINLVRILHDDGTWADYGHLLRYSANVVAGQRIEAGVEIGLSGSSGFSSGPHLHFVIQRNDNGRIVSVPFKFITKQLGSFVATYKQALVADTEVKLSKRSNAHSDAQPKKALAQCRSSGSAVIDAATLACMRGQ